MNKLGMQGKERNANVFMQITRGSLNGLMKIKKESFRDLEDLNQGAFGAVLWWPTTPYVNGS